MEFFNVISLLITKKMLGYILAGVFCTYTMSDAVWPGLRAESGQVAGKKEKMLENREPMHEGVNDYIEITGWDGNSYWVAVELNYHKNANGTYRVQKPQFFMVQEYSGITLEFASLNMMDTGKGKICYTCNALINKSDPSLVDLSFNASLNKPGQHDKGRDTKYISVKDISGDKWNAYIDSTFNQVSDSTALLKFRLVKA